MSGVRPVKDERRELARKVRGRLPHLDMVAVGDGKEPARGHQRSSPRAR